MTHGERKDGHGPVSAASRSTRLASLLEGPRRTMLTVVFFLCTSALVDMGALGFVKFAVAAAGFTGLVYRGPATALVRHLRIAMAPEGREKEVGSAVFAMAVVLMVFVIALRLVLSVSRYVQILAPLAVPVLLWFPFRPNLKALPARSLFSEDSQLLLYPEIEQGFSKNRYRLSTDVEIVAWEGGTPDGRTVIFLNGFLETAVVTWKKQMIFFSQLGHHVMCVDLRGQGESCLGRVAVSVPDAAEDLYALATHVQRKKKKPKGRVVLVAHGVNGSVAWALAARHPEIVDRCVFLCSPHPTAFARAFRAPWRLVRLWPLLCLQIPILGEWRARKNDFAMLLSQYTLRTGKPGAVSREDVNRLRAGWRRAAAIENLSDWSAAFFTAAAELGEAATRRITVPVLSLAGVSDTFVDDQLVLEGLEQHCDDWDNVFLKQSSHFPQNEHADAVNNHVRAFLDTPPSDHGDGILACFRRGRRK